jgi:hypothetical protein
MAPPSTNGPNRRDFRLAISFRIRSRQDSFVERCQTVWNMSIIWITGLNGCGMQPSCMIYPAKEFCEESDGLLSITPVIVGPGLRSLLRCSPAIP